jgi:hypothetical protein
MELIVSSDEESEKDNNSDEEREKANNLGEEREKANNSDDSVDWDDWDNSDLVKPVASDAAAGLTSACLSPPSQRDTELSAVELATGLTVSAERVQSRCSAAKASGDMIVIDDDDDDDNVRELAPSFASSSSPHAVLAVPSVVAKTEARGTRPAASTSIVESVGAGGRQKQQPWQQQRQMLRIAGRATNSPGNNNGKCSG